METDKGCIHLYCGDGKGKTTAAMGLALRAVGAGLKVRFIQFLKGGSYAEHKVIRQLEGLTFLQFGKNCLITGEPDDTDKREAAQGLKAVQAACQDKNIDLVVADELSVALSLGLIEETPILALMKNKLDSTELVITGRGATPAMIDQADLVTEMKGIKHYYQAGRSAKKGIEY